MARNRSEERLRPHYIQTACVANHNSLRVSPITQNQARDSVRFSATRANLGGTREPSRAAGNDVQCTIDVARDDRVMMTVKQRSSFVRTSTNQAFCLTTR